MAEEGQKWTSFYSAATIVPMENQLDKKIKSLAD